MLRAYKYRIYPTDEQKQMLAKTFGCCRYVYNWALDMKEKEYKETGRNVTLFEMQHRVVAELKGGAAPWLKGVSAKALQFAIIDLYDGYKKFFEQRANKPKYRTKDGRQHYHDDGTHIKCDFRRGLITIPKIKDIPCVFHRHFCGRIKQVSIELQLSGSYYASILVDDDAPVQTPPCIEPENTVGIDTGFYNYITTSNGIVIKPIRTSAEEIRKRKRLQRRLRKCKKGSRKFSILKHRIARLDSHTSNRRHDYIHKITHKLVSESQATTFCVEDLKVKDLQRNKNISRSMRDVTIFEFYRQLEYKCKWAGKNYIKINHWSPSSKQCSCCGYIYKEMTLDDRNWTCPKCGTHHERDLNAAINIKYFGLSNHKALPSV